MREEDEEEGEGGREGEVRFVWGVCVWGGGEFVTDLKKEMNTYSTLEQKRRNGEGYFFYSAFCLIIYFQPFVF